MTRIRRKERLKNYNQVLGNQNHGTVGARWNIIQQGHLCNEPRSYCRLWQPYRNLKIIRVWREPQEWCVLTICTRQRDCFILCCTWKSGLSGLIGTISLTRHVCYYLDHMGSVAQHDVHYGYYNASAVSFINTAKGRSGTSTGTFTFYRKRSRTINQIILEQACNYLSE